MTQMFGFAESGYEMVDPGCHCQRVHGDSGATDVAERFIVGRNTQGILAFSAGH